jgi:hypothetical protein
VPSYGEGFGIVFFKRWRVGSKVDGSREVLLGGRLGRPVDPNLPEGLVKAIAVGATAAFGRYADDGSAQALRRTQDESAANPISLIIQPAGGTLFCSTDEVPSRSKRWHLFVAKAYGYSRAQITVVGQRCGPRS